MFGSTDVRNTRRKRLAVIVAAPVLLGGMLLTNVTAANAGVPGLTAEADCEGVVSFEAMSWAAGNEGENDKIGVSYSDDGGETFEPITDDSGETITSGSGVDYRFASDNGNKFGDAFELPEEARGGDVRVRVEALGEWGRSDDGEAAPSGRSETASVELPECAEPVEEVVLDQPVGEASDEQSEGDPSGSEDEIALDESTTSSVDAETDVSIEPVRRDRAAHDEAEVSSEVAEEESDASPVITRSAVRDRTEQSTTVTKEVPDLTVRAAERRAENGKPRPQAKDSVAEPAPLTPVIEVKDKDVPKQSPAAEETPELLTEIICKPDHPELKTKWKNHGDRDRRMMVNIGSVVVDEREMKAGGSGEHATEFGDMVNIGSIVKVSARDGDKVIKETEVPVDCAQTNESTTTVDVTAECEARLGTGALIKFTNEGNNAEVFDVMMNGGEVDGSPVTVEGGETSEKFLALEGESTVIKITSDMGFASETPLDLDCAKAEEPEVIETTVTSPPTPVEQLAETGLQATPMMSLASLMVGAGLAMLALRPRRPVAVRT